ncbi:MAG: V-type ATP synthase subunit D [Bacteroidales bacterium]
MAIKYQFNKTSLHELGKQLSVREKALPTLKNKESALRLEVKRAKDKSNELKEILSKKIASYQKFSALWGEFNSQLISVKDVKLDIVKIAGIETPQVKEIIFDVKSYNLFQAPLWYSDGIAILKELVHLGIESEIYLHKMGLLDIVRKKTTQKVNLYEKVQIPGYNEAILKIKRFLEDQENLSKASQKIVKVRKEREAKYDN